MISSLPGQYPGHFQLGSVENQLDLWWKQRTNVSLNLRQFKIRSFSWRYRDASLENHRM